MVGRNSVGAARALGFRSRGPLQATVLALCVASAFGCGRSDRKADPPGRVAGAGGGGSGGGGGRPGAGGGGPEAGEGGVGDGAGTGGVSGSGHGRAGNGGTAGSSGTAGNGGMAGTLCQPPDPSPTQYFADTQEELEALAGVSDVQSLVLTGPVNDLKPLRCLTRVRESLDISYAPELVSLSGLEQLESVGRLYVAETAVGSMAGLERLASAQTLEVIYNDALETARLPALATADLVYVQHNNALDTIALPLLATASSLVLADNALGTLELRALTEVDGNFDLSKNRLENLTGLESLTAVGGAFNIGQNLLATVDGASSLERVTAELTLDDNPLRSLRGFEKLESVSVLSASRSTLETFGPLPQLSDVERIVLEDVTALTKFEGLAELTHIDELTITVAPLVNLDGLEGLTSMGTFSAWEMPELATLDGLRGLTSVDALSVGNAPELVDIDGLGGLTTLGSLALIAVPALENLDGLSGLTEIGELTVSEGLALSDLDGIGSATRLGLLSLGGLPLTSLAALQNLSEVSRLGIAQMPNLSNIDAVGSWSPPPGEVTLIDLPLLTSVEGLSSLRATTNFTLSRTGVTDLTGLELFEGGGTRVEIDGNPALRSLHALTSVTGAELISVTDNPVLPTCEADWLSARTNYDVFVQHGNDDNGVCP
jgi:hypothetical protein